MADLTESPPDEAGAGDEAGPARAAWTRWIAIGVVVALAAGSAGLVLRSQHEKPTLPAAARGCGQPGAVIEVGGQIPGACKVEVLGTGDAVPLSEFAAGKPMVVNFWATWCAACVQEMPDLQKVYTAAGGQVQFLGLDLLGVEGEVRSAAAAFAKQTAVSYPLAYDDGGLLYGRISLRVLAPTTVFVRADGTLAGVRIGQVGSADLRGLIRQFLGVEVPA